MEYKPVHFHIYDPSGPQLFKGMGNDRAKCFVIECSMSHDCELHHIGKCSLRAVIGWHRCPYGRVNSSEGYTKRARKFREWINKKKEQYKGVPYVKEHSTGIYKIGEYYFLPFAHIEMNENIPFLAKSGFMLKGNAFIKAEAFNKATIKSIISFRPHAIMGGEITSYRKESVPLFLKHLSEKMPDLFEEICEEMPASKAVFEAFSNVGRQAIASTLKPGCTITKREESWTWDGEWFTSNTYKSLFNIVDSEEFIAKFRPKKDATFKIQSDDQIDENTVFVS